MQPCWWHALLVAAHAPRGLCVWLAPPGAAELRRLQPVLRGEGSVNFGISAKFPTEDNDELQTNDKKDYKRVIGHFVSLACVARPRSSLNSRPMIKRNIKRVIDHRE